MECLLKLGWMKITLLKCVEIVTSIEFHVY
jgi:hypothetical protein